MEKTTTLVVSVILLLTPHVSCSTKTSTESFSNGAVSNLEKISSELKERRSKLEEIISNLEEIAELYGKINYDDEVDMIYHIIDDFVEIRRIYHYEARLVDLSEIIAFKHKASYFRSRIKDVEGTIEVIKLYLEHLQEHSGPITNLLASSLIKKGIKIMRSSILLFENYAQILQSKL